MHTILTRRLSIVVFIIAIIISDDVAYAYVSFPPNTMQEFYALMRSEL